MTDIPMQLLNAIAQTIYDKKGSNILALDVRGISNLTDYCIIAEGNIDRHLKAIAFAIKARLGEIGYSPLFIEGENIGDWVILDYGVVMVHLFIPEYREKYALEELWNKAKIVDVQIVVPKDAETFSRD